MKLWRIGIAIVVLSMTAFAQNKIDLFDKLVGKNWYGIYMDTNKVGYAYLAIEKTSEQQWQSIAQTSFKLAMQNAIGAIEQSETRIYKGNNGELVNESCTISSPSGSITTEGSIVGDSFNIITTIAGQKSQKAFPRPIETLSEFSKIELWASTGKLHKDDTMSFISYIPDPPISAPLLNLARVTGISQEIFNGVPTRAFSVSDSIPALSITSDLIFTDNGLLLEQSLGILNLRMKLEPEEAAKKIDQPFDLLSGIVIKAENGPADSRKVKQASYLITGYDATSIPKSNWLTIKAFSPESACVVVTIDTANLEITNLPIKGDEYTPFLSPEPLIQSDNPEIISKAKEIVGNQKNTLMAAKLINDWVYKNVKKEFSPEFSNSLTTLHSLKGDCGEHTALAVGLLRAAGIPARTASGVVYWPEGQGFAYHAWTEVYIGRWIQMDPSWGETFANATHIMLTNGGFNQQLAVISKALKGLKIKFESFE